MITVDMGCELLQRVVASRASLARVGGDALSDSVQRVAEGAATQSEDQLSGAALFFLLIFIGIFVVIAVLLFQSTIDRPHTNHHAPPPIVEINPRVLRPPTPPPTTPRTQAPTPARFNSRAPITQYGITAFHMTRRHRFKPLRSETTAPTGERLCRVCWGDLRTGDHRHGRT